MLRGADKMTVIFDLDGTLVNSLFDLGDSVNGALSEMGLPLHSYEEYRMFVGNGTKMLVTRSVPENIRGTVTEKAVFDRFSALYEEKCLCKTLPYNGIEEALLRLKENGAKLAVASNKPFEFCRKIVNALFGEGMFDVIQGSRENVRKKPQPDIIFSIMAQLGVSKDDCVIVGDSDVDAQTAKNAGLKCIGCSWGYRGRDVLENACCDIVIDSPKELCGSVIKLLRG